MPLECDQLRRRTMFPVGPTRPRAVFPPLRRLEALFPPVCSVLVCLVFWCIGLGKCSATYWWRARSWSAGDEIEIGTYVASPVRFCSLLMFGGVPCRGRAGGWVGGCVCDVMFSSCVLPPEPFRCSCFAVVCCACPICNFNCFLPSLEE